MSAYVVSARLGRCCDRGDLRLSAVPSGSRIARLTRGRVRRPRIGINIWAQRLIAFVISAFFMGIGGVLQAHFLGTIAVKNFWLGLTFVALPCSSSAASEA